MSIVLDVETLAIDGASSLLDPVTAPGNYKDPEKIAAYIAEKQAAQVERAGLYAYTARIIALGWCEEGEDFEHVEVCNNDATEARLLREFWARVDKRDIVPIVTFGGRRFDLPLLMIRSMLLGVPYPKLDIRKYYSPHPDILEKLTFNGELDYRSLSWFAKRFGLDTSDAFSGKEIATLYEDGNWDAIKAHCASDVRLTRQLAERLGVMRPRPVVA